eukprot:UN12604
METRIQDYSAPSGLKTIIVHPDADRECGTSIFTNGKLYKGSEDVVASEFKLLICGYCRITSDFIVPPEIMSLCQSYYRIEFDQWDAATASVNYRVNSKMIEKIWSYAKSKWSNAFGTKIIERYDHRVWRIKIIKLSNRNNDYDDEFRGFSDYWYRHIKKDEVNTSLVVMDGPLFGIMPSNKTKIKNIDVTSHGYVLNICNGKCTNKHISKQYIENMDHFAIKNGDIISITLNLVKRNQGTLT